MLRNVHLVQVLYSLATQRYTRGQVFNIVMTGFLIFMTSFGLLFPRHEAMHLTTFASSATKSLPLGKLQVNFAFSSEACNLQTGSQSCAD